MIMYIVVNKDGEGRQVEEERRVEVCVCVCVCRAERVGKKKKVRRKGYKEIDR